MTRLIALIAMTFGSLTVAIPVANASAFVKQATPQTNTAFVKQASEIAKRANATNPVVVEPVDPDLDPIESAPRQSNRILEFEVPDERMLLPSARISPLTRALAQ